MVNNMLNFNQEKNVLSSKYHKTSSNHFLTLSFPKWYSVCQHELWLRYSQLNAVCFSVHLFRCSLVASSYVSSLNYYVNFEF